MTDRLELQLKLRDGRMLGYADLGDPQGIPVFHFHGGGTSRFDALVVEKTAQKLGIRLIAPDRPGLGLSTFKPGRKVSDWPDDISDLADGLKLERFGVYGVSGGGPYALACAWKIPQRLISASSVSGIGPFSEPDATEGMSKANRQVYAMQKIPGMLSLQMWSMKRVNEADYRKMMANNVKNMAEPDRRLIENNPEVMDVLIRSAKGAFAQSGVRGAVLDARLWNIAWTIPLKEISMKVHIWQGDKDQNVSPAMGRYLARIIPNAVPHFLPGEAHLSLLYNHQEEILTTAKTP
jgi:pimeloyl-ACP methyl ester carboxylesterase